MNKIIELEKKMDLRDKNNTFEGYQKTLEFHSKNLNEDRNKLSDLQIKEQEGIQVYSIPNNQVIQNELDGIYSKLYEIFLINYSMGKDLSVTYQDYINVINAMFDTKRIIYYTQLINLLSAGILLDVEKREFIKIANLIKMDYSENKCLKDYLIDLLVNYKISEWERVNKQFFWKKPYQAFEEIELLSKSNKTDAVIRLKKYLQKQWLPSNNSQSRGKIYHSGYWSFESGAIVKIFDLDDTLLKDFDYYPYDMVNWKK
jgi:hypothetical protein